ncbi:unnamed protein product [Caenorhabditis angaria]|uniref:ShKT domain-containing protein n=1 Tax=Caenorhabditis angaria TaxID=860376 RepID=A0A9P1J0M3_9PELO|nr:unnamed protein product [Caenorhabditis angaria]
MSTSITILLLAVAVFASTDACGDTASQCSSWVKNGFCKSAYYTYDQKKAYCGASCGFCPGSVPVTTAPASGSSTCTDSASACASWKNNGFCTNSFYSDATRIQYCQKSCNLCSASATTDASGSTVTVPDTTISV